MILSTGAKHTSYIVLPDYPNDGPHASELMDKASFPPRKGVILGGKPYSPIIEIHNLDGTISQYQNEWHLPLDYGSVSRPAIFRKID